MRELQPGEACAYCEMASRGDTVPILRDGHLMNVRPNPDGGPAVEVLHDKRGCWPVCADHASWRKHMCSVVGGHDRECRGEAVPEAPSTASPAPTERMFPVLWQGRPAYLAELAALGCPREVPWPLIEAHRETCLRNHSQTPERLAERGGLAPSEIVAVVHGHTGPRLYACWSLGARDEVEQLQAILRTHTNAGASDTPVLTPESVLARWSIEEREGRTFAIRAGDAQGYGHFAVYWQDDGLRVEPTDGPDTIPLDVLAEVLRRAGYRVTKGTP